MKILKIIAPSSRVLLHSLLVLSILSDAAGASNISYQDQKIIRQVTSGIEVRTFNEIPAATEPCTPAESEWWSQLRQAGNDLQKKTTDEKTKKRFYLLVYEGQQKAYRVPLKDRPTQKLVYSNPTYNRDKYRITGVVELSVEFRADASVGNIQIVRGLGTIVDEGVIHAWHQAIFLPAIKDGTFATQRENVKTKFTDLRH